MLSNIPSKLPCRPSRPPMVVRWVRQTLASTKQGRFSNLSIVRFSLVLGHRPMLIMLVPQTNHKTIFKHAPWWKWLATCGSPMVALPGHRQGWPSPLMCWETLWECNTATIRHQHEHEIFFWRIYRRYFGPLPHYPITPVRFGREKLRFQQVAWISTDPKPS